MSTQGDLLDFFSSMPPPTTAAKSAAPHAAGSMQQASMSRPAAAVPAASTAPTSPMSDFGESFDLTSGALEAELAAEDDREHAFSGAPGDDDLWSSLQEKQKRTGAGGDGTAVPMSVSHSLGLEPSSSLYAASKSLDTLSTRMNDAAGRAIDSINAFDRRHGVSAALRQTDAKYALTDRLEGMQTKLTAGADRISQDVREKVHKVKEARANRSRSNSISSAVGSASSLSGGGSVHRSSVHSQQSTSKSGSRRGSGQFISFTEADRIPPPPAHNHSHHLRPPAQAHPADSDDEPNPSPTVAACLPAPPVAMPVAMPAASAPGHRAQGSRSSFSYEPQAIRTPPTAASTSSVSKAGVVSPPVALFELGPPLSDDDDDADEASDVESPPHTPVSSVARSRSHSLSFNSLRLGDVDLHDGYGGGADGLLSPDGPSPQAQGGLLGR